MNKIELIKKQIEQIEHLKQLKRFGPEFKAWERKTTSLLERIFGKDSSQVSDYKGISYSLNVFVVGTPDYEFQKEYLDGLEDARAILTSMIEELEEFNFDDNVLDTNPYLQLLDIFNSFHKVVRQLRLRHDSRPTLNVQDEYDVQDLLHSLLQINFEDIRPEEWTPSYAGKSSRVDFLLKDHEIVVEVKKTRQNLGGKELGDQLIIDTARYKNHPNCKRLICFIYDPEGLIANPTGFATDLSSDGDFKVEVIVKP